MTMRKNIFATVLFLLAVLALTFYFNYSEDTWSKEKIDSPNMVAKRSISNLGTAIKEEFSQNTKTSTAEEETSDDVASVQELMSTYQTWESKDLRNELSKIEHLSDAHNIYEKVNRGMVTDEKRKFLLNVIRNKTAIYKLLIERQLKE